MRTCFAQVWPRLSDEETEDECHGPGSVCDFVGCPDELCLGAVVERPGQAGPVSHGTAVADPAIIEPAKPAEDARSGRDPQDAPDGEGQGWRHSARAHAGEDALGGHARTVTLTKANASDIAETHKLVREDDEFASCDSGHRGTGKRPEVKGDEHLSQVVSRTATRSPEPEGRRAVGDAERKGCAWTRGSTGEARTAA